MTSGRRGEGTGVRVLVGLGAVVGVWLGVRLGVGVGAAVSVWVGIGVPASEVLVRLSVVAAETKSSAMAATAIVGVGGLVGLAVGTAWVGGGSSVVVAVGVSGRPKFPWGRKDSAVGASVGKGSSGGRLEQADRINSRINDIFRETGRLDIDQHYSNRRMIVISCFKGISESS